MFLAIVAMQADSMQAMFRFDRKLLRMSASKFYYEKPMQDTCCVRHRCEKCQEAQGVRACMNDVMYASWLMCVFTFYKIGASIKKYCDVNAQYTHFCMQLQAQ